MIAKRFMEAFSTQSKLRKHISGLYLSLRNMIKLGSALCAFRDRFDYCRLLPLPQGHTAKKSGHKKRQTLKTKEVGETVAHQPLVDGSYFDGV